jgi:hypothetical protein
MAFTHREQWSQSRQGDKWGANRCATGELMRCSKCGSDNPTGKRFCGDCGVPFTNCCPKCGAENPPGKRFCGDCGTEFATNSGTAQSPPASSSSTPDIAVSAEQTASAIADGERKTVTWRAWPRILVLAPSDVSKSPAFHSRRRIEAARSLIAKVLHFPLHVDASTPKAFARSRRMDSRVVSHHLV